MLSLKQVPTPICFLHKIQLLRKPLPFSHICFQGSEQSQVFLGPLWAILQPRSKFHYYWWLWWVWADCTWCRCLKISEKYRFPWRRSRKQNRPKLRRLTFTRHGLWLPRRTECRLPSFRRFRRQAAAAENHGLSSYDQCPLCSRLRPPTENHWVKCLLLSCRLSSIEATHFCHSAK